jgi:hypothetical protein
VPDFERRKLARLLVPLAVAALGAAIGEWSLFAIGLLGTVVVAALRLWTHSTAEASMSGPAAVFISVSLAFLAGAFYLLLVVGGATAWIIAALSLLVSLGAGYLGYGLVLFGATGRRPRGADRVSAMASLASRDIGFRTRRRDRAP